MISIQYKTQEVWSSSFKSVFFVALPADDFNMVSFDALFVYWWKLSLINGTVDFWGWWVLYRWKIIKSLRIYKWSEYPNCSSTASELSPLRSFRLLSNVVLDIDVYYLVWNLTSLSALTSKDGIKSKKIFREWNRFDHSSLRLEKRVTILLLA